MPSHTATGAQADASRLKGKTAAVTGGRGGIGSSIARTLASHGATVMLLDLQPANSDQQPSDIGYIQCDVTNESSVAAAARKFEELFERCDVLVNNAGILAPHTSLLNLAMADWHRTIAVNLTGPLLCTREFGRLMLKNKSGAIINIASIAGSKPNATPAYSASKAALLALTRHTAVEWGPQGIRTNAVSPGFIKTALSAGHYSSDDLLQARINSVPLRRLGTPENVADAVAYLAGPGAEFINAQEIVVDGGFLETTLMHLQPKNDQYGSMLNA